MSTKIGKVGVAAPVSFAPIDYEGRVQEIKRERRKDLRKRIAAWELTKDELDTVKRKAEQMELTLPALKKEMLLSPALSAEWLMKDPGKQSVHQKLAETYLRNWLICCQNFKAPPAGGPNAIIVVSGAVHEGEVLKRNRAKGKSIDFCWEFNHPKLPRPLYFYASHKYTKESGGSQDNQHQDLKSFVKEVSDSGDSNRFFVAIADGAYYDASSGQEDSAGKLRSKRRELTVNSNSRVTSCEAHEAPAWVAVVIEREFKKAGVRIEPKLKKALNWMRKPEGDAPENWAPTGSSLRACAAESATERPIAARLIPTSKTLPGIVGTSWGYGARAKARSGSIAAPGAIGSLTPGRNLSHAISVVLASGSKRKASSGRRLSA